MIHYIYIYIFFYREDDYLQIYLLSYNYYSLFAIGIALVVGVIVSLVTGRSSAI